MVLKCALIALWMMAAGGNIAAQEPAATGGRRPGMPGMAGMNMSGATNDLFMMAGSDFDRPGVVPRANYSIGIGHMFGILKNDPLGNEVTFEYMYENSGSHGFWHSASGEHTESVGLMRNFRLPGTKVWTGYTWVQTGITTFTGNPRLLNWLDSSVSLGAIAHFKRHSSIWVQESYGKVVSMPWFTTASIGYGWSW